MNFLLALMIAGQVATATPTPNFIIISGPVNYPRIMFPGVEAFDCPGGMVIYGSGGDEIYRICPDKYRVKK